MGSHDRPNVVGNEQFEMHFTGSSCDWRECVSSEGEHDALQINGDFEVMWNLNWRAAFGGAVTMQLYTDIVGKTETINGWFASIFNFYSLIRCVFVAVNPF